jgi:hypothetical protein
MWSLQKRQKCFFSKSCLTILAVAKTRKYMYQSLKNVICRPLFISNKVFAFSSGVSNVHQKLFKHRNSRFRQKFCYKKEYSYIDLLRKTYCKDIHPSCGGDQNRLLKIASSASQRHEVFHNQFARVIDRSESRLCQIKVQDGFTNNTITFNL